MFMGQTAIKLLAQIKQARKNTTIFLLLLLMMFSACATAPELTVELDDWIFERKAINIEIEASADLNVRSGRPHALLLGIFHLNDRTTFDQFTATRKGTIDLLNKGKIDETVAFYQRIPILPGEHKVIWIDRAQTAQFIGIIAGYYQLDENLDTRVFDVPIEPTKRGLVEKLLVGLQLIANEAKARPSRLYINIDLGRLGTRDMKDITKEVLSKI